MPDIMFVSDCMNEDDERQGAPYRGRYGGLLKALCNQVGINPRECGMEVVFPFRPTPAGDLASICGGKPEGIYGMPPLVKNKYANSKFTSYLTQLYTRINAANPNIIVALGATASWALLGTTVIKKNRGTTFASTGPASVATGVRLHRPFKVLPTYHPSAVLRDWTLRPIFISDLDKAKRFSSYPEITRPQRFIWTEPTIADLLKFEQEYMQNVEILSCDIETKGDQITCIGFAPDATNALVVPFFSAERGRGNYWDSFESERTAWHFVKRVCETYPTLFQNGMYDMHRLWRGYGIKCKGASGDTMLMHHALQPEMEKGLGFLGSIYTDEASWKFMRKNDTIKKED